MRTSVGTLLAFLAVATLSFANNTEADCKFAKQCDFFAWNHAWDFAIYSEAFCGGEQLRYHGGSTVDPLSDCITLPAESDVVNKKWKHMRIHSFVFTSRPYGFKVTVYDGLNCGGKAVGHSVGNWKDVSTSAPSKIRSIRVSPWRPFDG
ncbi:hypothetical protein BV22DRAFT_1038902 [Leucogyrophana mollusca]|uniref:Uncharacterized protein n=1 Tax=Leucogyrophana mollusca TaxID=85980 RepID=A0ACB8B6J2_9AGAM|nr:hypothetical protein BV22DRAFT_1038902 [Leucogyrophana mollusca]